MKLISLPESTKIAKDLDDALAYLDSLVNNTQTTYDRIAELKEELGAEMERKAINTIQTEDHCYINMNGIVIIKNSPKD